MRAALSLRRIWAVMIKEFRQLRRDRATFAMMIAVPVVQLLLFGYAINTDPKHLPTVILAQDHSPFARDIISGLKNSGYFDIRREIMSPAIGERMLKEGSVQFVVTIPDNFGRDIVRGEKPAMLIEADATD
ncbi:MAG: ABC transporter permease, partial [Alphaproteobacteria bacterium]|nr:ABC transporter permease [Alphaproteobacteria bacterium]